MARVRPIRKQRMSSAQVGRKYGFRSGLEDRVAEQLKQAGLPVNYEQHGIEFTQPAKSRRYTPDFALTKRDGNILFIETKGRFLTADRQKHLMIKKDHPDLDIRFVFTRSKTTISKTSATTYAGWCEKHGFLYADREIPVTWLAECFHNHSPRIEP